MKERLESQAISMYAKGMTVRDITDHLQSLYGIELSATSISNITDNVSDEAKEWYSRTPEIFCPIVFWDAVLFKVREEGRIVTKAAYIALGINREGCKDILIACIDRLKGFPETRMQLCIIHQIRNTLKYVASKDQKAFMRDLKRVYGAESEEIAMQNLERMMEDWTKYGVVLENWLDKWANLSTYFNYGYQIRRLIYTTNTVEGFNRQLCKVTKSKALFPNDEALKKTLYLCTQDITKKWSMPYRDWRETYGQFAIEFGDRAKIA